MLSLKLFCMICCLFSNCSKNSNILLRSLPCVVNVPRSHVPVLLALQWSVAWISSFNRGREHLWIVFSFNSHYLSKCSTCTYMHGYHQYRTSYTFHLQMKPPISTPPQPIEGAYFFLFVCFVPLENFSLIWRRHHQRLMAANILIYARHL